MKRLAEVALYSPAVAVLRSVRRESGAEPDWAPLLNVTLSGLRSLFNKPYAKAIIRRVSSRRTYAEQVTAYCRDAHFAAVTDEYIHLLASQYDASEAGKKALEGIGAALSVQPGAPQVRVRGRRSADDTARAFCDGFWRGFKHREGPRDATHSTREAFNSPFWPFVLTTTSLGQEGLDFHLYCRDIVHWNLPSNPVDLEQREGRINRRNSLIVRKAVAQDVADFVPS